MRRFPATLLMAGLPFLTHGVLIALGWRDWRACLEGQAPPAAAVLEFALRLAPLFTLLSFLPFCLLALTWYRWGGRLRVALWLGLYGLLLYGLLPLSSQHHCDGKGLGAELWPFALALIGFPVSILALWNFSPTKPDSTPPDQTPPGSTPSSPS